MSRERAAWAQSVVLSTGHRTVKQRDGDTQSDILQTPRDPRRDSPGRQLPVPSRQREAERQAERAANWSPQRDGSRERHRQTERQREGQRETERELHWEKMSVKRSQQLLRAVPSLNRTHSRSLSPSLPLSLSCSRSRALVRSLACMRTRSISLSHALLVCVVVNSPTRMASPPKHRGAAGQLGSVRLSPRIAVTERLTERQREAATLSRSVSKEDAFSAVRQAGLEVEQQVHNSSPSCFSAVSRARSCSLCLLSLSLPLSPSPSLSVSLIHDWVSCSHLTVSSAEPTAAAAVPSASWSCSCSLSSFAAAWYSLRALRRGTDTETPRQTPRQGNRQRSSREPCLRAKEPHGEMQRWQQACVRSLHFRRCAADTRRCHLATSHREEQRQRERDRQESLH